MSIKNLRASGSTLLADVVVGANEYGSDVAVQLRLNRKDPDVVKALEPLTKLLADTGHEYLTASVDEKFIQTQVRERTKVAVESEKKRLLKNATEDAYRRIHDLERSLASAQSETERWKTRHREASYPVQEDDNAVAERPTVPALVGLGEIADILGVTKQRVHQLATAPGFPEPVARLRATPVWARADIDTYGSQRAGGAGTAGASQRTSQRTRSPDSTAWVAVQRATEGKPEAADAKAQEG